jgi:hypothetical protein
VVDWGFVVIMSIGSTSRRRLVVTRALAVVIALAAISAGDDWEVHAGEIEARICSWDSECD